MKPVRFCISADWHEDNYLNLQVEGPDMLTPQAKHIQNTIGEIRKYMKNNDISSLLMLGDVSHRRNIRPDSINNLISRIFSDFQEDGIDVHVLEGNHDQSNPSGTVSSIRSLGEIGTIVYPNLTEVTIEGIKVVACPFMEHRKAVEELEELRKTFRKAPRIFIGHLGIDGSVVGTFEKKIMEPISLNELYPEDYLYMYFGHYHKLQTIGKNAMYVGAPCQHNFGDSGQERGFWDVKIFNDGESWKVENTFIPITSSPRFYEVSVEEFNFEDYRDIDYVKVTGVDSNQRQELLGALPNLSFEGESVSIPEDEIILSVSDDWEDWIDTWVGEAEKNPRRRRGLNRLGKEILEKVKE